jgi:hypothetical protein
VPPPVATAACFLGTATHPVSPMPAGAVSSGSHPSQEGTFEVVSPLQKHPLAGWRSGHVNAASLYFAPAKVPFRFGRAVLLASGYGAGTGISHPNRVLARRLKASVCSLSFPCWEPSVSLSCNLPSVDVPRRREAGRGGKLSAGRFEASGTVQNSAPCWCWAGQGRGAAFFAGRRMAILSFPMVRSILYRGARCERCSCCAAC